MGLIKVALKTGICVYAVKYTYDEGAWSSADDAIKFKEKMCNSINNNEFVSKGKSHFQAYVPMPELPQLPQRSEVGFITKHYYNKAVKGSIRFIEMTPCYLGQGFKKISDAIKQATEQQPQVQQTK